MNTVIKALLCSLPLALLACGEVEQPKVQKVTQDLYVASLKLWDQSNIPVCWVTSGNATEKSWVQDEVSSTWEAVANIDFTGWSACPSNMSGFKGIAVTGGTLMVVYGGLGQPSDDVSDMELDFSANPQTTWTRCVANALNREECIRASATHEFGHSLGFAHEHNRNDTDPACTASPQGSLGDTTPTEYDSISIMNYCGGNTTLSALDKLGAEISYPGTSPLSIACSQSCFPSPDGLVLLTNGIVHDEWRARGAYEWWESGSPPEWMIGSTSLGSGTTLSASALPGGLNDVNFFADTEMSGTSVTGTAGLEVHAAKWTAVAMTVL